MLLAVQEGHEYFDDALVALNHGNITCALADGDKSVQTIIYLSTLHPSSEFMRIVYIMIEVDAPSWFYFKSHPIVIIEILTMLGTNQLIL